MRQGNYQMLAKGLRKKTESLKVWIGFHLSWPAHSGPEVFQHAADQMGQVETQVIEDRLLPYLLDAGGPHIVMVSFRPSIPRIDIFVDTYGVSVRVNC